MPSVSQEREDPSLNSVLARNIEALARKRREEEKHASFEERLAERISKFAGSMLFVYIHLAMLAAWIAINLKLVPSIPPFDESFVILATAASVEAIFLSTFILIAQNRAAVLADRRSDLDVQISLLTEHEVTKVLAVVTDIAARLNVESARDPRLAELKKDVAPERVMDEIEERERQP